MSFLIDCSGFCTCCLLCCILRSIKLLPEAHFECLQNNIFSTELQLDWMHSSEGLSSAGLLFSIQIIPCLFFGLCYCWLFLQTAGYARACCKDENEVICILVSGCIAMFDVDWVGPPSPLFSSFYRPFVASGQLDPPGLFLGPTTYSKMATGLEMSWVPLCHPPKYNRFQGSELPSMCLFLLKSTWDINHGCILGGKKARCWKSGSFMSHLSLEHCIVPFRGVIRKESKKWGGENQYGPCPSRRLQRFFFAINRALVVWVTSCAHLLPEWEEEKAGRRSSPHFHQELVFWVDRSRERLLCWRTEFCESKQLLLHWAKLGCGWCELGN